MTITVGSTPSPTRVQVPAVASERLLGRPLRRKSSLFPISCLLVVGGSLQQFSTSQSLFSKSALSATLSVFSGEGSQCRLILRGGSKEPSPARLSQLVGRERRGTRRSQPRWSPQNLWPTMGLGSHSEFVLGLIMLAVRRDASDTEPTESRRLPLLYLPLLKRPCGC